ncbi:hypothetical protein ACS0TY_026832 [Phlomoides rotata]
MGHTIPEVAIVVALGIFAWTLVEYTLYRFRFHIKTKTYWGNTLHYLLHGCHHKHPMDGLRLVFPPTTTTILLYPFWNMIKLFSTPTTAHAAFGGGLLGYVMYDVTHYYVHHGQPTIKFPKILRDTPSGIYDGGIFGNVSWSLRRREYHLNHHFWVEDKGYEITSFFCDKVFGTLPPSKLAGKSR